MYKDEYYKPQFLLILHNCIRFLYNNHKSELISMFRLSLNVVMVDG